MDRLGEQRHPDAPAFAMRLDADELVALFRLLSAGEVQLPTALRRLEREVEREIYQRFTIEELEQGWQPLPSPPQRGPRTGFEVAVSWRCRQNLAALEEANRVPAQLWSEAQAAGLLPPELPIPAVLRVRRRGGHGTSTCAQQRW